MLRASTATAGLLLLLMWQISGRLTTDVVVRSVPPVIWPAVTSLPQSADHPALQTEPAALDAVHAARQFVWSAPVVENRVVLSNRAINACLGKRRGWIVVGAVAADSVRTRVVLESRRSTVPSVGSAAEDHQLVDRCDLCRPVATSYQSVATNRSLASSHAEVIENQHIQNQQQPSNTVDRVQDAADERRVDLREFWLPARDGQSHPGSSGSFRSVLVRRCATAGNVGLFWDVSRPCSQSQQAACESMARELAERVIPAVCNLIGPIVDINHDGEFAVVISSGVRWVDRVVPAISASTAVTNSTLSTPLFGYTRVADFLPGVVAPEGNGCDVMYLTPELLDAPQRTAVLIHEATHAACFSARLGHSKSNRQGDDGVSSIGNYAAVADAPETHSPRMHPPVLVEEDWLCEAIAHCAEKILDSSHSNIAARESLYLQNTSACPLVVPDFSESGLWRHPGCRGAGARFLESVVASSGPDLLRQLATSRETGSANLERATGRRFEDLVLAWAVEMVRNAAGEHPRELATWPGDGARRCEFELTGTSLGFVRWSGVALIPNNDPAANTSANHSTDFTDVQSETDLANSEITIEWRPVSGMTPLLLIVAES